ncbi:hormogonium polysaccharide biosynthesis glycosyltransferase HpsE [Chlorogloeopsis sp. ULAP01]|uniref:hormogonium polysaccharide biosynthesis glycosyltransferase HpsE n=1 Tax=Chlorogloeopsis sp. ULAP01 TaxID=3056483 RepID=UPI0025AAD050|nr:hormogonium polysaccharide biosynthesis glycosyltransferase HpsE [Chlorogloeopsis sp. ULAP01]MDM9381065.1 hormogonium polysaccharide biosynthesis glycosyltransferase HpsE [Chlorogloeopsis sp. ULAP01]
MNNCLEFTVAIPTYNGANRLPKLLECLRNQINTENLSWEIIVVDNNSTDNTSQVIQAYQENWQCSYPLKYSFEEKQGAAYARKRAVMEAKGQFIGFLDDDNYPTPTWVSAAYAFGKQHPQTGAYASQIHPEWEVEPPENFERIAPFLAITERGSLPLLYKAHKKLLPPSAGLVVRRQAWLDSVPNQPILTGRVVGNMLTSEDLEMLSYIQKFGWEIWYNPAMEIYHKIPRFRLTKEYLIPFFRGIGLSRHVTRMLNIRPQMKLLLYLAYMFNDLRKLIFHLIKYGWKLNNDLVIDCEMQLLLSSLVSPFYLWKYGYLKHKK